MDVDKLWQEYKENNNMDSRNKLIMVYLPVVKKVVNTMLQGSSYNYRRDDYNSMGIMGLIDAINKYDKYKKVKFETYASIRIKGSIRDYMRKQDWVSRRIREKQKKIEQAEISLREKLLRPPTIEEISQETELSINEVNETIEKVACADIISFENAISSGLYPLNKNSDYDSNPEKHFEKKELEEMLSDAIKTLDEREQKIISLYYTEELKLKEIGQVMNISESRVSQIMKRAVTKLNKMMIS